ncbi:MAG: sulfur carrier protein ThiS [Myxococcales bacterium]|nr:sulfur carrier protein ThiS [Myxococcales bacterium]
MASLSPDVRRAHRLDPLAAQRGRPYALRMRLVVNGEERQVESNTTIGELLASMGLADTLVAVERNEEVVPRAQHARTRLAEGDHVEVVHFVGGG